MTIVGEVWMSVEFRLCFFSFLTCSELIILSVPNTHNDIQQINPSEDRWAITARAPFPGDAFEAISTSAER